jgi:hypothetical protein
MFQSKATIVLQCLGILWPVMCWQAAAARRSGHMYVAMLYQPAVWTVVVT